MMMMMMRRRRRRRMVFVPSQLRYGHGGRRVVMVVFDALCGVQVDTPAGGGDKTGRITLSTTEMETVYDLGKSILTDTQREGGDWL
jgi:hypothetical protein